MKSSFLRGFSLIGILVSMAIIVVLFAVMMNGMKGAIGTGTSQPQQNSAASFADRETLRQIHQSLASASINNDSRLPTPTSIMQSSDKGLDTTANFYSSLIAQQYISPVQLEAHNEQSDFVYADEDYNYDAYDPSSGVRWDTSFTADLYNDSNVSYAHMPLLGERLRRNWVLGGPSGFPVLGNRGPAFGKPNTNSIVCDAVTGMWAGNVVFADGHVSFFSTMAPPDTGGDNIFNLDDDDYLGNDALLTFTEWMTDSKFGYQHD